MADDRAEARRPARSPTGRRDRGSRTGGSRAATASGSAYVAATGGIVAWNAVSKTATCGMVGSSRRARSIASTAGPLCSGASSTSSRSRASSSSSIRVGSRSSPPCTTRCATATMGGRQRLRAMSRACSPRCSSTTCSFRLVEPALTTRISPARSSPESRVGPRRAPVRTHVRGAGCRPSAAADGRPCPPAAADDR